MKINTNFSLYDIGVMIGYGAAMISALLLGPLEWWFFAMQLVLYPLVGILFKTVADRFTNDKSLDTPVK